MLFARVHQYGSLAEFVGITDAIDGVFVGNTDRSTAIENILDLIDCVHRGIVHYIVLCSNKFLLNWLQLPLHFYCVFTNRLSFWSNASHHCCYGWIKPHRSFPKIIRWQRHELLALKSNLTMQHGTSSFSWSYFSIGNYPFSFLDIFFIRLI